MPAKPESAKNNPPAHAAPAPAPASPTTASPAAGVQRLRAHGPAGLNPADVKNLQQTVGNRGIQRVMKSPGPMIQRVLNPEEQLEKQTIETRLAEIAKLKYRAAQLAEPEGRRLRIRLAALTKKAGEPSADEAAATLRVQQEAIAAKEREARELQAQLKPIRKDTNAALRKVQAILTPLGVEMSKASGYEIAELATVNDKLNAATTKIGAIQSQSDAATTVELANAAKAKAEAMAGEVAPLPALVQSVTDQVPALAAAIAAVHLEMKPLYKDVDDISIAALKLLIPVTTHAIADKEALKLEIQTIKANALKALTTAKTATKLAVATQAKADITDSIVEMEAAKAKAVVVGQKEIAIANDDAQGGHVVGRHGPEADTKKVFDRLSTGYAPDGVYSPAPGISTQFTSYTGLNSTLETVKPLLKTALTTGVNRVIAKMKLYRDAKIEFEKAQVTVDTYVPAPVVVIHVAEGGSPPAPEVDAEKAKLEKDRDDKNQLMATALNNVGLEVTAVNTTRGLCKLIFDGSETDPAKLVSVRSEYQIVHDHGATIGKGFTRASADENDHINLTRTRTKFDFGATQFVIGGNLNVESWRMAQHFPTNEPKGIS